MQGCVFVERFELLQTFPDKSEQVVLGDIEISKQSQN